MVVVAGPASLQEQRQWQGGEDPDRGRQEDGFTPPWQWRQRRRIADPIVTMVKIINKVS